MLERANAQDWTQGRRKGFRPANTLASPHKPSYGSPIELEHSLVGNGAGSLIEDSVERYPNLVSGANRRCNETMVRERSPHKASSGQHLSTQKAERKPLANISAKMQSPSPKREASKDKDEAATSSNVLPEFGKSSPLRNPLKKPEPSIFMPRQKPKHKYSPNNSFYPGQSQQQSRGGAADIPVSERTFYLPGQPPQPAPAHSYGSALEAANAFSSQSFRQSLDSDAGIFQVPRNAPLPTIAAKPKPTFSSLSSNTFQPPYQSASKPVIDLTSSPVARYGSNGRQEDEFDPDAEIRAQGSKFGEPDPFSYVDSTQANDNIKNLLEGAFDDEDDKSNTRLRRRAKKASREGKDKDAKGLAAKLAALSVKSDTDSKNSVEEADEEQEPDDGTIEGLSVKLLPHQLEGVRWMIDREIGKQGPKRKGMQPHGGILADDMGLGKTIQSMTLILLNSRPAPDAKPEFKGQQMPGPEIGKGTLVVAPLALIKQWEDEIKTKVAKSHALKVLVHHGPSRTKSAAELKKYDVVITTYQTLTSEHAASSPMSSTASNAARIGCMGVHWYRLILDEAHSIKNRNAKSSIACYSLQAWYRWCLTGTPMQNNLDELQSLIGFLRIKPYSEREKWKEGIIDPMRKGKGGLAMKRLQVFLGAVMKRRTKDVLKKDGALNFGGKPSSINEGEQYGDAQPAGGMKIVKREVETIECEFDQPEMEFYLRLQNRADKKIAEIERRGGKNEYIHALVLLLRLRQACNHPELIEMAMNKDKDALTTGVSGTQTPRKGGSVVDNGEMDELAALMGGVSMQAKDCDVCQIELSSQEVKDGYVRCRECQGDLAKVKHRRASSQRVKKQKKPSVKGRQIDRKARNRKVVVDSDDETEDRNGEGEGEWIGDGSEQYLDLGTAGGTDDEDAEGGGDTLGSIDSDRSSSDDEDEEDWPPRARTARRRPVVKTKSDEESGNSDADDDESEHETSILAGLEPSRGAHGKPSTKIRRLLQILHAEMPKHKTIVFSQFTSMLDLIEPHFRAKNYRFARYDGSMKNDAREAALQALRTDPKCRILLCSLKCGSLGLNLTAASRVVIIEPFWNPFVEEQAIDRVHRLNQTVDVKVYRLTVQHTVEAEILLLQERKRELAAAAIEGSTKSSVAALSWQELLGLFKHDSGEAEGPPLQTEEDREMWEKFGSDRRLLEGPGGGFEQVGGLMERNEDLAGGRTKPKQGVGKAYREHEVFGRRW